MKECLNLIDQGMAGKKKYKIPTLIGLRKPIKQFRTLFPVIKISIMRKKDLVYNLDWINTVSY